jgi:hypothetical protein
MSMEPLRSSIKPLVLTTRQRILLRNALAAESENGHGGFAQREAIREFCIVSRDAAQRPEQLLIHFKESLIEAANEARLPYGFERSDQLARVVSVFIEEFYGFRTGEAKNGNGADGHASLSNNGSGSAELHP